MINTFCFVASCTLYTGENKDDWGVTYPINDSERYSLVLHVLIHISSKYLNVFEPHMTLFEQTIILVFCVTLVSFIEASSIQKVENKNPPVFAPYVSLYHLEGMWWTENPGSDEKVPFVP